MTTRIAIAVVQWEGKFLIGLRPAGVALAGLWEFPGGKIHSGETPATAATRECLEETGLNVEVEREYARVEHRYAHGDVELFFFACRPLDARQAPAERFRWVRGRELAHYEFPSANAAVIAGLVHDDKAR
jgi:mutator protein MutT